MSTWIDFSQLRCSHCKHQGLLRVVRQSTRSSEGTESIILLGFRVHGESLVVRAHGPHMSAGKEELEMEDAPTELVELLASVDERHVVVCCRSCHRILAHSGDDDTLLWGHQLPSPIREMAFEATRTARWQHLDGSGR